MDTDVSAALQRTRRYWVTDGLWELSAGISISLMALALMQWRRLPVLVFIPTLMIVLSPRVLAWARERITYPRSGYAAPRIPTIRPNVQRGIIMVFAVFFSLPILGMAFSLVQPALSQAIFRLLGVALPSGGCFLAGAMFANNGYYSKLPRFYLLAGYSLLVGLVYCGMILTPQGIRLIDSDNFLGVAALPFLCIGVALGLSGTIALRSYLHAHPQPVEEAG